MVTVSEQVSPIRAKRREHKWSLEQLAVKAGLSRGTVFLAEKGLASTTTLKVIARTLGCDVAELKP